MMIGRLFDCLLDDDDDDDDDDSRVFFDDQMDGAGDRDVITDDY